MLGQSNPMQTSFKSLSMHVAVSLNFLPGAVLNQSYSHQLGSFTVVGFDS